MWTLMKKPGLSQLQRGDLVYFEGELWNSFLGHKVLPAKRTSFTRSEILLAANDGMLEAAGTIDPITLLDDYLKLQNDYHIIQVWMGFPDAPLYWYREYPASKIIGGLDAQAYQYPQPSSSTLNKKYLGHMCYEDSPYEYPMLEFFWTRDKFPAFAVTNNGGKATKVVVNLMITLIELDATISPVKQAEYLAQEQRGELEIKHILSEDCYRW